MLDAGVGPTHINALLSCLNIPGISESLLKRHERHVGVAVEKIAQKSCAYAAMLEKSYTEANRAGEEKANSPGRLHFVVSSYLIFPRVKKNQAAHGMLGLRTFTLLFIDAVHAVHDCNLSK